MFYKITFFCIIAFATIYAFQSQQTIAVSGEINEEFNIKLAALNNGSTVTISSGGGHPQFAQRAAELILKKKLNLIIKGPCFSSCAEYLLPAANSISLKQNALIGFHQNPLMIEYFRQTHSTANKPLCHFEKYLAFFKRLQHNHLGRSDFWKETLSRIEVSKVVVSEDSPDCTEVGFVFKKKLWFPNSVQLRKLYGLEFTGLPCSESLMCARNLLESVKAEKGLYVIGDKKIDIE